MDTPEALPTPEPSTKLNPYRWVDEALTGIDTIGPGEKANAYKSLITRLSTEKANEWEPFGKAIRDRVVEFQTSEYKPSRILCPDCKADAKVGPFWGTNTQEYSCTCGWHCDVTTKHKKDQESIGESPDGMRGPGWIDTEKTWVEYSGTPPIEETESQNEAFRIGGKGFWDVLEMSGYKVMEMLPKVATHSYIFNEQQAHDAVLRLVGIPAPSTLQFPPTTDPKLIIQWAKTFRTYVIAHELVSFGSTTWDGAYAHMREIMPEAYEVLIDDNSDTHQENVNLQEVVLVEQRYSGRKSVFVSRDTGKGSITYDPNPDSPEAITVTVPSMGGMKGYARYQFLPKPDAHYAVLVRSFNSNKDAIVQKVRGPATLLWKYADSHGKVLGVVVEGKISMLDVIVWLPGGGGNMAIRIDVSAKTIKEAHIDKEKMQLPDDELWIVVDEELNK